MRILCLENDVSMLDLLNLIFDFAGYEVLRAQAADEAWSLLSDQPIDLFVLSINHADSSGRAFYKRVKSEQSLCQSPTLLIIEKISSDWLNHMVPRPGESDWPAEADTWLVKPFSPREIIVSTSRLLDRHGKHAPTKEERAARLELIHAKYLLLYKSEEQFNDVWKKFDGWMETQ